VEARDLTGAIVTAAEFGKQSSCLAPVLTFIWNQAIAPGQRRTRTRETSTFLQRRTGAQRRVAHVKKIAELTVSGATEPKFRRHSNDIVAIDFVTDRSGGRG